MRAATRSVWLATGAFALGGTVAGLVRAVSTIWPRTWVLEFQAGRASTALEKASAILQSVAIDGVGFLVVGLVLALAARGLVRLVPRFRDDELGSAFGGALLLCSGAFFGWSNLAWLADDALAFLTPLEVLGLDLAGIAAFLAALVFFDHLVRRCPWTPRACEPSAVASLLGAACATWAALKVVKTGNEGWRDPMLLAGAGVVYLGMLPVAGLVAKLLDRPIGLLRDRALFRPLVPRIVTAAVWCFLALCCVVAVRDFDPSPLSAEPSYARLSANPQGEGPNVVVVTVDTLRADHLGCYGYPRPTSPFLDSIAAQGTLCADATAAAAWTKPATATILTGLHPSRHGALYHGSLLQLPDGKQTLAEAFRERGYVTAGFVANPNLKKVFGFDRGFDVYYDSPVEDTVTLACLRGTFFGCLMTQLSRREFNWNYENDVASMNREVLAWLERNHDQRFFLYAHYIDPHIPYDPPARYREEFAQEHGFLLFNERKQAVGIDRYDGEIRYCDDGLEQLVTRLQKLGAWDNTLFVFTSDHGEEFFEHGALGHGFSLYQEIVHVPLILRGPGVPAGKTLKKPVQILDLAATVLALSGKPSGKEVAQFGDGTSFLPDLVAEARGKPEPLFMESEFGQDDADQRQFVFSGVRSGPWKLVLTERNQFFPPSDPRYGREALYDLVTDPSERRNLFREEANQGLVQDLLARLRSHAQFLQEHGFRDVCLLYTSPSPRDS